MLAINDLKSGTTIVLDGEPYRIIKHDFIKMGRGQGAMRTSIKNLKSGKTIDKTFKGQEKIDLADITRSQANYLYNEGDEYYFMDQQSYDQFFVTKEQIGDAIKYLTEDIEVDVLNFNNQPINIELPTKITYSVKQAPPGIRGDTAQGSVTKKVTLNNDLEIDVPLFIDQGDTVIVNTESGKYVSKA